MSDNNKKYWKGLEQLSNDTEFIKNADREFSEFLPIDESGNTSGETGRRDFLKFMGFGIAAASLAACEAPVKKAIPYLNKPEEIDPSVANFYASTYTDGGEYCSILVKTREGRPIKIEGNALSGITKGGTSARVQASVLSLYDKERLQGPLANKNKTSWDALDQKILAELQNISSRGGQIRIVSNTIISPSTKNAIAAFASKYPGTQLVQYDPNSSYALIEANRLSFGSAVVPSFDFGKANTVVSFGADFLGTWISEIEYNKQYSKTRKLGPNKKEMSRHYHFESILSLTGSNADYRTPIKPSQEGLVVAQLYNLLSAKAGRTSISTAKTEVKYLTEAANDLWNSRGKSLVVSGSKDVSVQILINAINDLLGNYGSTIDITNPSFQKQGSDLAMFNLIKEASAGQVNAVIFYNCNPVYDHPKGKDLEASLSKVSLKISTSPRLDETANIVNYVAPDHHYLESWNDAEPKRGFYSLGQPAISPLFKTRQTQESLLRWSGNAESYYDFVRNFWKTNLFPKQSTHTDFDIFLDRSLHDGVFEVPSVAGTQPSFGGDLAYAANSINKNYKPASPEIELVLYEKVGIGTGSQANNPWLQEFPDPISKATWDNYFAVSKSLSDKLDVKQGDLLKVTVKGKEPVTLPVLVQPGAQKETISVAIGYGRTSAGKVANNVGANVYPWAVVDSNGTISFNITEGISAEKVSGSRPLAQTQTHETFMGRESIIQETILSKYKQNPQSGRYFPQISTSEGKKRPEDLTMWNVHKYNNHHWMMAIDLNSCTGCSACVISCQAENNIPVVGREEVLRRREMHWLRIDRYYSSDADLKDDATFKELEIASENPQIVFQPMLCQQCNNAPCETVCPVNATTHSTEGLNQMAYNRCIGTRYCANNCPYKVRRFNWFKYHDNKQFSDVNISMNDQLGKMVLNPDVTVRSRGVMEKCSFCVQRIQEGKLTAKKEGRRPIDGEIVTACASACPSDAIVFGDINDPESAVFKLLETEVAERAYNVIGEINTRPNIYYLTKIRNKEEAKA